MKVFWVDLDGNAPSCWHMPLQFPRTLQRYSRIDQPPTLIKVQNLDCIQFHFLVFLVSILHHFLEEIAWNRPYDAIKSTLNTVWQFELASFQEKSIFKGTYFEEISQLSAFHWQFGNQLSRGDTSSMMWAVALLQ